MRYKLGGRDRAGFHDLFFGRSTAGAAVVCGWVGEDRFVSDGTPGGTRLERVSSRFEDRWAAACRPAATDGIGYRRNSRLSISLARPR